MLNYLDDLKSVYGDQIGDIGQVFQGSEADLRRKVQEWTQSQGIDLDAELASGRIDMQEYLDSINNIGQLFQSGGQLVGSLYNPRPRDPWYEAGQYWEQY